MGPEIAYSDEYDYMLWLNTYWIPAVIQAALKPSNELNEFRSAMKKSIQKTYSWEASADILESLWADL